MFVEKRLTTGRADFKPDIFDTSILQKGYKMIWEKGMFCSCYDDMSGQPNYNCPVCQGKGYVYFDPKKTKALVTSINGRQEQERIGLDHKGYCYLTPMSVDDIGFRDRITFPDITVRTSEVITHGDTPDDKTRYPMVDVVSVRRNFDVYNRGQHFDISSDSLNIQWKDEYIASGEKFSVLYSMHPVYIVLNPIHEIRGTYILGKNSVTEEYVSLPRQFQIKREDFLPKNIGEVQYGY